MSTTIKRKANSNKNIQDEDDLIYQAKIANDNEDADSTDSEESEYSGLEEEESSDESFEEFEEDDSENDNDDSEAEDDIGSESDGSEIEADEIDDSKVADSDEDDKKLLMPSDSDNEEILTKKPKAQQKEKKKKTRLKSSAKTDETKVSNLNATKDDNAKKKTAHKEEADEYEVDSSDEEDIRNTVGNVPMEWYREFEHIGYDLDGKRIGKPIGGDELDKFLDKMENPNYWRTVNDKMTGQKVVLSDKDCDAISRLKQGRYVDPNFDPYQPWVDFFTNTVMQHPLSNRPEPKSSFIPSNWERLKVGKLVDAMKKGWIKPRLEKKEDEEKDDSPKYYLIWDKDDTNEKRRQRDQMIAPKMALPGHEESYNPPPEYLFTEEEELAWKEKEPYERRIKVIPKKYSSLRSVPGYTDFVKERFERCLDLYLCPRKRIMKMNIDPEDLIPKLPKPRDLMPFPVVQSLKYEGHTGFVRSISVCPTGQWIASGSDDGTVRLWEVQTTRCMKTLHFTSAITANNANDDSRRGVVRHISWNPNPALSLLAVAIDNEIIIVNTGLGDKLTISSTDDMLSVGDNQTIEADDSAKKVPVTWFSFSSNSDSKQHEQGLRVKITHPKLVSQVTWHGRGDYFAVTLKDGGGMSVLIHQLSKRRSQNPFSRPKGLVQCVLFHPTRPFFFVATQRYVRVYNLLKQELTKKLLTNVKWVSSMAVHSGGDHVIVGSYDCRLSWFDLDLSSKPYKTLRHHKKAVRHVSFHKRYPLIASASDDGTVIVCHGQVYNDLLKNPLIVPVKILRGHQIVNDLGVLCCEFHPTQPWLFSSGADNTVRLFT